MKKNISFLPLFFGWLVLFNSCKKEYSCENCLAANQPAIVVTGSDHPPIANAGYDTTIILPANSFNLNGSLSSDPDNNITVYAWSKIAGPSSFNLVNANEVQTQVNNLVEGVYLFELKVTDATGLFDRDTVQVNIVLNNQLPPCTDCKIVFVSDRDGNAEIYSCKTDGSGITRLTHDAGTDGQPAWSPDGSQIAFISNRTGLPELYIMNADGSNVVRKTFAGTYVQDPTWSPDGKRIAYSMFSNASMNIWAVEAVPGGSSSLLLFEAAGWEAQPAWSPDGTKIALVSDMQAYDFVFDIFIMNSDGTNITAITNDNMFDHIDYLQPRWSPDGTKLALTMSHTIGVDQYETSIGIMNPNGTGLTSIIPGAAPASKTSWSPDGKTIVYTSLAGNKTDIAWVASNGSASGIIVTNGWDADWQH